MESAPTAAEASRVKDGEEIEVKLTARDPAVLDELARLESLAGYRLEPGPGLQLHDRYWDRPKRRLAARRVSLRIREQG